MNASPTDVCGSDCQLYRPGHNIHAIQGRLVGEMPWEWRDAVVVTVDGQRATLSYLLDDGTPTIWYHRPLSALVRAGDAVVIHERYYIVRTGGNVFCVELADGIGPVPEPDDELLRIPDAPIHANLGTGVGAAMSGATRRWSLTSS
jgi:hypothetical protein